MRITYMGTPEFSARVLEGLLGEGLEVAGVVTQPDRAAGRGRKLRPPPVKKVALERGIPVIQPERVRGAREVYARLREWDAEALVVVAFGQFLPRAMLELHPLGSINLHASLLPAYRGAAPVNWALINGETETGLTTMRMSPRMDAGPILLQYRTAIDPMENAEELLARLVAPGVSLLVDTLEGLRRGTITPRPQDESAATYAPCLRKEDGLLDWKRPALELHNRVRGLAPRPGAFTFFGSRRLRILASRPLPGDGDGPPGTVHRLGKRGLSVQTGEGRLELLRVQLEGCRALDTAQFVCGCRLEEGARFGAEAS
jgi:methionyl-tRNA formyltransferase